MLGVVAFDSPIADAWHVVGAIALVVLGVVMWFSPLQRAPDRAPSSAWRAVLSGFFLTMSNAATLAVFAGALGTLVPRAGVLPVAPGVFTGSLAWWAFLTGLTARWRGRISFQAVQRLRRLLAIVLVLAAHGILVWMAV